MAGEEDGDPLADIRADLEKDGAAAAAAADKGGKPAAASDEGDDDHEEPIAERKGRAEADDDAEGEDDKAGDKKDAKPAAEKPGEDKKSASKRYLLRQALNEAREREAAKDARIAELQAALDAKAAATEGDEDDADGEEAEKPKKARTAPQKTEAQIRAEILADEQAKAARNQFVKDSNAAFDKGAEVFGDEEFQESVDTLNDIGMRAPHVEAALATDAPERVLFVLGQDPAEAKRVFALPPLKMAAAMAKIANSRQRAPKVSDTPKPINPVNGTSADDQSIFDPNASDAVVDKVLNGALERLQSKYAN